MSRELELLFHQARWLVFGIFGHLDDASGEGTVRVGGSGVFVAPFQVLTARHVCRDKQVHSAISEGLTDLLHGGDTEATCEFRG
jgi:hypothetical protein